MPTAEQLLAVKLRPAVVRRPLFTERMIVLPTIQMSPKPKSATTAGGLDFGEMAGLKLKKTAGDR